MAKKKTKSDRVCAWILPDQLNIGIDTLRGLDQATAQVVMIESLEHLAGRPVHKQQLAFTLAAMRHFAQKLRALGWNIFYYAEQPNYNEALHAHLREFKTRHLIVMEPADHEMGQFVAGIPGWSKAKLELRPNNLFLLPRREFARWFRTHKRRGPREFYRFARQRLGLLLDAGGKPLGGEWAFEPPTERPAAPPGPWPVPRGVKPNFTTTEVLEFVRDNYGHYPGELQPFEWPVTKSQLLEWLHAFVRERLPHYLAWQEAMVAGQELLYRSWLSPGLNLGLLSAAEVLQAVLQYHDANPGRVSLPALESFLRGLVGTREYAAGLYAATMPELRAANPLKSRRPMPTPLLTGQTEMRCVADVMQRVLRRGHASEPERRLVLANLAQLADVAPADLAAWLAAWFVDGVAWAALPQVAGPLLPGPDGAPVEGPAVAPGGEIRARSDFCEGCRYDPDALTGDKACPYNYLYWSFLDRHRDQLAALPRFRAAYKQLDRLDTKLRRQIHRQAEAFLELSRVKS